MARILVMASNFPRWKGDSWSPFILFQAEGMARLGHEVHVLAPHATGAAMHEQFGEVQVHRFRYAPERWQSLAYGGGILQNLRRNPLAWALVPAFLLAEMMAMRRIVRRQEIELIHAHWFIPQGLIAALGTFIGRRPIVMTAHAGDVFATRDRLRRGLLRHAAARTGAATAVSGPLAREFEGLTGIRPDIIPMGVDVSRFHPAGRRAVTGTATRGGGPHILSVGRLAAKKGLHHLLDALALVVQDLPGVRLTVVGDGPIRPDLEAQAARLGISDRVSFLGMLPNEDLPARFAAADLFVVPSIIDETGDREGLPVSILEAAASGVPVVASDVGGISDFVEDGVTGLLVRPGDATVLADAIQRLASDGGLVRTMVIAARARVEDGFSWDSVSDRFDTIYRRLLAA
jgi:glycosyltransferase involved in cell wall biosynthesis